MIIKEINQNTNTYVRKNKEWSRRVLSSYEGAIFDICYILFAKTRKEVVSKRKTAINILCRKTLCNALVLEYGLHPDIVANFVCKDRTTILYYLNKHDGHYEYHIDYKEAYDMMMLNLRLALDLDDLTKLHDVDTQKLLEMDSIRDSLCRLKKENQKLKEQINSLKLIIE